MTFSANYLPCKEGNPYCDGSDLLHGDWCQWRLSEEEERRVLRWLMDVQKHAGPLERGFATDTLRALAWFEAKLAENKKSA